MIPLLSNPAIIKKSLPMSRQTRPAILISDFQKNPIRIGRMTSIYFFAHFDKFSLPLGERAQ
ncbi:hypothetical protein BRY73_23100 [Ochrobactrum sp. P6BS-III]|nr:hypothetical protein BRY73_23100 [Ochrobactrum sp. P6BS-III]